MARRLSRPERQRGYILALNLAVLALLLLGASYVGQRVADAVSLAKTEQSNVDANFALESARARLFMLLATAPRTFQGLVTAQGIVRLDAREYRIGDSVRVTLQDMRGMMSINGTNLSGVGRERIERFLGTWGVNETKAVALTDALLDYRDADDFRRLNGAERDEYRALGASGGISELRNADLLSSTEVQRVYGWRSTPELWGADPVTDYISPQTGSTFNPNTAGWRALVGMAGVDAAAAKGIVENRIANDPGDISGLLFGAGVGDPFGANSFVLPFPGPTLVITLRVADSQWGYRMVVTHTPGDNTGPWRISSVWRLNLPPTEKPLKSLLQLPEVVESQDPKATGQIKLPF